MLLDRHIYVFGDRCVMMQLLWRQQQQPHQWCRHDISSEWDKSEPMGHCVW